MLFPGSVTTFSIVIYVLKAVNAKTICEFASPALLLREPHNMSSGVCIVKPLGAVGDPEQVQLMSETASSVDSAASTDPAPESEQALGSESENDDGDAKKEIISEEERAFERAMQLRKRRMIERSLADGSTAGLKIAAVNERGLLCDDYRRLVWPKIGGVSVYETSPRPSMEEITQHAYYSQVVLDVKRSLKRFPPSIAENQRIALQDKLVFMIMRVLMKNPELHYYQGYHDICVTILLVLGEEVGFLLVDKLSCSNLRRFMDKTMARTADLLEHIYPLLAHENPELCKFLERAQVGIMFCLSWVITWFGHVLADYDTVVRLFDLFLSSHSWMPVYLSAAIVLHAEKEILALECDLAPVHCYLSRLVEGDLPFEALILRARLLLEQYPPTHLQAEQALRKKQLKLSHPPPRRPPQHGPMWRFARYVGALVAGTGARKGALALAVLFFAVWFQTYRKNPSLAWF